MLLIPQWIIGAPVVAVIVFVGFVALIVLIVRAKNGNSVIVPASVLTNEP